MPRDELRSMRHDRAAYDVTEIRHHCPDCQEDRVFKATELDIAGYRTGDLNPVLQDAVNGEPIFRCGVCGRLEPDLVERSAYDYEWRDTGYEVGPWRDEELDEEQEGAPPKPAEWDEETAMEPRGRGVHPDRLLPQAESVRAPPRSGGE